eukprot:COSAG01_NODE_2463_length_7647_cov_6.492183_9_plen_92_part_00
MGTGGQTECDGSGAESTERNRHKKHLVLPYETCLVGHPTARNERGFEMAKHLRDEILREMGPDHADGHVPTRYIHETRMISSSSTGGITTN